MPKVSSRFRTRKINFKTPIPIHVGSLEIPFDDDLEAAIAASLPPVTKHVADAASSSQPYPPSSAHNLHANGVHAGPGQLGLPSTSAGGRATPAGPEAFGDGIRVETGVDKDEEGELHLQAVISASAAALQRTSRAPGSGGAFIKAPVAHIPTPDATGLVANYQDFYKHNIYTDPSAHIRFGDTVEETMGIAYTMDEEDADWLESHNATLATSKNGSGDGETTKSLGSAGAQQSLVANNGHYPPLQPINGYKSSQNTSRGRDKVRETDSTLQVNPISEDDFELVMDLFERATDRKTPTLHLNLSRIPSLEDLESAFPNYIPTSLLRDVRDIAKVLYPYWKERRLAAGGKNIVPQLDYDITNETPYVCFRRREAKMARKTRRTDTQTVERLVRLKSDLSSAQDLIAKILEREQCKKEALVTDIKIFESRAALRTLKRHLGEATDGDERLLLNRKEKRKRDSVQLSKIGLPTPLLPATHLGSLADPLPPYKDRLSSISQRIEKDMLRKRDQEVGWEDVTDLAYNPTPQAPCSRFWRATEMLPMQMSDGRASTPVVTFDQIMMPYIQSCGPRFRKRIGRSGRVLLDRINVGTNDMVADEYARRTFSSDRWRYDSDVASEMPAIKLPVVIDDFESKWSLARISLVANNEWESLTPNTQHLEEAIRWTLREPDPLPPVQIIGKLPGHRLAPAANNGTTGASPTASAAVMSAGRSQSVAANGLPAPQSPSGNGQMRRSSGTPQPSTQAVPNGVPQQPAIRRLMWENGAAAA